MPLPQTRAYSCQSCVTAQARWMLGLSDATGRAAVTEVDELTGRKPGRPIATAFSLLPLLAAGCEVIRYGKPDPDLHRLRREGIAYFSAYYAEDPAAGDAAFWTPHRLAAYATRARREITALTAARAQYPGRFTEPAEWFTVASADALLAAGYLIMTTYVPEDAAPDSCHAILLYGYEAARFMAYEPACDGPGLVALRHQWLAHAVRPYAYAIRLEREAS
jgi:hypothetical protein